MRVAVVGASDDGTWRRLIVIPFGAKIQGKTDIKNYTDYLVENASRFIEPGGHIVIELFGLRGNSIVAVKDDGAESAR